MKDELLKELIDETRMEDIAERYQEIAKIVGVQKFVELSNYKKEFNGSNDKELADKYNLTVKQIWNILKDEPPVGQMTLDELFNGK